jgi:hypothetical protein
MKKFNKEDLLKLIHNENVGGLEKVEDTLIEHVRGTVGHKIIFKCGDKYYCSFYRVGVIKKQHISPYENEPDKIECYAVKQVEKVVTVYELA